MANEIALSGIHHIGIVVQDIAASVAWYSEKLGFTVLYRYGWPGVQAVFIGRDGLMIELFQNDAAAPMAKERRKAETNLTIGGIGHFALEVPDLDKTVAMLRDRNVDVVSPPREVPNSGGCRFAFIHDNEQMLVELFQSA